MDQPGKAPRRKDAYFLGGLAVFEAGLGPPTDGLEGGPLGEKCDGLEDA